MLHAILFNKAGKSLANREMDWRQFFTPSEDSLTSTIFGNLLHLPVELFWQILNKSCYGDGLTNQNSRILSVEFWPHWTPTYSNNTNFIEPDIFIRTTHFDLIIEAKRFDYNKQSSQQWENEFQGYLNDYGNDQKEVIFLALGGISNEEPEIIKLKDRNMRVIKCRWIRLLNEVKNVQMKLEKIQNHISNIDSTIIIINDIVMGFGIHGYATGKWLEDEDFSKICQINSCFFNQYFVI